MNVAQLEKELFAIYVCPTCKAELKTEAGFKRHLDRHFSTDQHGTMKAIMKISSTPPKAIVDAMCVDALSEIFRTFEVTSDGASKLDTQRSFTVALNISLGHLDVVNECLHYCQRNTLANKHKHLRDVAPYFITILTTLGSKCQNDDTYFMTAARASMQMIKDFHLILHEDTLESDRAKIVKEWIRQSEEV